MKSESTEPALDQTFLARLSQSFFVFQERLRKELAERPDAIDLRIPGPQTAAGPLGHIGPYAVMRQLGSGATGFVLLAQDLRDQEMVALKILRPELATMIGSRTRFEAEANSAAQLNHRHIVRVKGVETAPEFELPFIVMEYVAGFTLSELVRDQSPMAPTRAAQIVLQIGTALQHAHECGVVHRDLKPSNILIEETGDPKLTDFGLARLMDGIDDATRERLTLSNQVLGTPEYMSPEQAYSPSGVDARSDIYGLGMILYELLTGHLPFVGTAQEILQQIIFREPAAPRSLHSGIPRKLEIICLHCLQKEPGRRYQSAGELAEDLTRFLAGKSILARPIGIREKVRKWVRRRLAVSGLIAGMVVLVVMGIAGAFWQFRQTQAALAAAEANLNAAETNQYFKDILLADNQWLSNDVARAEATLDACPLRYRHFEWYYLRRRCDGALLSLRGHAESTQGMTYSSDGRRIASAGGRGDIKVWDALTGEELLSFAAHARIVRGVAFSPNDKFLASGGGDGKVKLWDAATAQELRTFIGHEREVFGVAFSPDGKCLASGSDDGTAKIWDVVRDKVLHTLRGHTGRVSAVAFDADGRFLASAGGDRKHGEVKIWNVLTGLESFAFAGHLRGVTSVKFSPDGQHVASASMVVDNRLSERGEVKIWNVNTGKETVRIRGHSLTVWSLALSPDGERLASAGDDKAVRIWDTATGEETLVLRQEAQVESVSFSPDGRRLALTGSKGLVKVCDTTSEQGTTTLGSGRIGVVTALAYSPDARHLAVATGRSDVPIFNTQTGEEELALQGHSKGALGVAYGCDGQLIATAGRDSIVRVWNAMTGQEVSVCRGHSGPVAAVTFSPDGRHLASAGHDKTVRVWEPWNGNELLVLVGHPAEVRSLMFSPDGRRLASSGLEGSLKVWDAQTGAVLVTLPGSTHDVSCVAFSPKGQYLASGGTDRTIRIWNANTGAELQSLRGHTAKVTGVAFSPDGQRLASSSDDRTVKLWDMVTSREILTLRGPTGGTTCVAFTHDGQRLAAGSWDQTVRIWNATREK